MATWLSLYWTTPRLMAPSRPSKAAFPAVKVLPLKENLGYAGNNNVGIEAALAQGAEWVFVLNEDTLQAPDCLTRLIEYGESESTDRHRRSISLSLR